MPRIRSIHPGAFTDEAIVGLSAIARWFLVGLWCQAFDDGVFEWKPISLKMRILPADNVDVGALLDEIASAGIAARFDHGGRQFGALRNFARWQRPKKPNSSSVLPASLREYVGISASHNGTSSEDSYDDPNKVPDQFRTGVEIVSQREEGGGRRERDNSPPPAQSPAGRADARGGGGENHGLDQIEFRRRCEQAAGGVFAQSAVVARWQSDGLDLDERVLPMIRAIAGDAKKRGSAITSWAYFDGAIRDPARSVSASNVERTCRFVREGEPEFLRLSAAKGPTLVIGRDPSGYRGTWVYDSPGASP